MLAIITIIFVICMCNPTVFGKPQCRELAAEGRGAETEEERTNPRHHNVEFEEQVHGQKHGLRQLGDMGSQHQEVAGPK